MKMVNMTLTIPKELHSIVKNHSEIKWSEIARRAMWKYAKKLELMDDLTKNSKLTEEDVLELDNIIKSNILKKYKELQRKSH